MRLIFSPLLHPRFIGDQIIYPPRVLQGMRGLRAADRRNPDLAVCTRVKASMFRSRKESTIVSFYRSHKTQ